MGKEEIEGQKLKIEFYWILFEELKNTEVYPTNVAELMNHIEHGVQYFIYRE